MVGRFFERGRPTTSLLLRNIKKEHEVPIQTTLVKLTVNCAKHGDAFYHELAPNEKPCDACKFLVHYNQQIRKIENEVASLNNALEGFLRTQSVVTASLGNKILTGAL